MSRGLGDVYKRQYISGVSSISSAKEWNTRMVAIGMISSRRFCSPKEVSVLGATIAISGVVIRIQGLPAKVRIIFVSSLQY